MVSSYVLLSGFNGFALADAEKNTDKNNKPAPEATADEAKISFWDLPYLKEAFMDTPLI